MESEMPVDRFISAAVLAKEITNKYDIATKHLL
jgi:hypothetical protein